MSTTPPEKHPSFSLNFSSVEQLVGKKTKEAMVYGFRHAHYLEVQKALCATGSPIQQVYDWALGSSEKPAVSKITKKPLEQIRFQKKGAGKKPISRLCKAGITNLILENYKRRKEGNEIIPLIFCVGSKNPNKEAYEPSLGENPPSLRTIAGRSTVVTHSELRRAFRLCKDFMHSPDPVLREIAEVARDTIKLVTVDQDEKSDSYSLQQISPTWDDAQWDIEMRGRKATRPARIGQKLFKWRHELTFRAHMFDFNKRYSARLILHSFSTFAKYVHVTLSALSSNPSVCPDFETVKRYFFDNPDETKKLLTQLEIPISIAAFVEDPLFKDMYDIAKTAYRKIP